MRKYLYLLEGSSGTCAVLAINKYAARLIASKNASAEMTKIWMASSTTVTDADQIERTLYFALPIK